MTADLHPYVQSGSKYRLAPFKKHMYLLPGTGGGGGGAPFWNNGGGGMSAGALPPFWNCSGGGGKGGLAARVTCGGVGGEGIKSGGDVVFTELVPFWKGKGGGRGDSQDARAGLGEGIRLTWFWLVYSISIYILFNLLPKCKRFLQCFGSINLIRIRIRPKIETCFNISSSDYPKNYC